VASRGAGEGVAVGAVDRGAVVEPAVEVAGVDEEIPEVTTDDLDEIDALPLT
jgi:hypothetical protein